MFPLLGILRFLFFIKIFNGKWMKVGSAIEFDISSENNASEKDF